jgi:hypothetical protein
VISNGNLSGDVTTSGSLVTTISANAVTTGKIADGTILDQDIANATISNSKLVNSSVTVTAGTGLSGGGTVSLGGTTTLNNAGVLSAAGTLNQVLVNGGTAAATGAVTLSLPQSIATTSSPTFNSLTLTNPLGISSGGTNANTVGAAGSIAYSTGTAYSFSAAGTSGQILQSGGAGTPTWGSGSGLFIQNQNAAGQAANFWITGTGQIDNNTATPALRLSNSGGNALTVTTGSSSLLNTSVTGTLSSTGTTTLGTTGVTANTLGNTTAGTTNAISGNSTFDGANQTTANLILVKNLPTAAASWGILVDGNTPVVGNATQGIFSRVKAAAGQNAVAGRFDATQGAAVTGVSITANTGTTSNTGLSISVNDVSRIGANINANGGGTGVVVNNASIGFAVPGNSGTLPSTATAFSAKLSATGSQTGLGVDLSTGVSGDAGVSIVNTGAANGISIGGVNAGGTGLSITTTGGSGETISGVGTGTGLGISGISSGTGLSVSAPTTGVAIKTQGAGAGTVALQVDNGPVRATGTNQFAANVAFTGVASGDYVIANPYAVTGATIIATLESPSDGVAYNLFVKNIGSGSFTIHSNAAVGVTGNFHYIIINH